MPICPFLTSLAVEVERDPVTYTITKVRIYKYRFKVSEEYCKSFAKGRGCKYFKNGKCLHNWTEKDLDEHIKQLVDMYKVMDVEVEVIG